MHKILKLLPPETAHKAAFALEPFWPKQTTGDHVSLRTRVFDKVFISNPLMLAAGVSKNAEGLHGFDQMGFAGAEVGSLMPEPRPGNKGTRLIRLADGFSLINWLGLPSQGPEAALANLETHQSRYGKNFFIGANFAPDANRLDLATLERLTQMFLTTTRYTTINKSCPNTEAVANAVTNLPHELGFLKSTWPGRPLLVKLGPTSTEDNLMRLVDICMDNNADGLVLFNTCPPELKHLLGPNFRPRTWLTTPAGKEVGGYSGRGMFDYTQRMTEKIRKRIGPKKTIMATGAQTGDQAVRLLLAGANTLQTNTGITLHGAGMLADIKQAIVAVNGTQRLHDHWPR